MMSQPMKTECFAEPMKIQVPVTKTFIQYPALRNPSLEAFFQERESFSCPASRMASIDEEDSEPSSPIGNPDIFCAIAKEAEYTVKSTFIDGFTWESVTMRNPSLEGFFQERELKSCPVTRVQSLDDAQSYDAQEFPTIDIQEWTCDVEHPVSTPLRSFSLDECLRDIEAKYQDLELFEDISTKANTFEDSAVTPESLSDCEEDAKPCAISLTNGLGLWSAGSAKHFLGTCKPCAFLWKDASGCQNGANCEFCHMCPPGEKQRRKKEKLTMRKMVRQFQRPQAFQGMGHYGIC